MRKYIIEYRIRRLERLLFGNKAFEGGAAGHMGHIYDFTDLTLKDIKDIITNLLSGNVEDVTEKLDGMNIQCTMNNEGKVVFIRNKGDLNSEKGGMDVDDIAYRWSDKEHVSKTYLGAAEIITQVFNKLGKKFFNPNRDTRVVANCECITAGKTNILLYSSAQVDFHNLWIYTRNENGEWKFSKITEDGIDILEKACETIDSAQLTPKVIIGITERSNEILENYLNQIEDIFSKEGLSDNSTINDYRFSRFNKIINDRYEWITNSEAGMIGLYNRWFNNDKSAGLRELKKIYKDNVEDLAVLDKSGYKLIVNACMKPLDIFFGRLGNSIILLCKGMVNAGSESAVINELKADLEEVVQKIKSEGSSEMNDKLTDQLSRLAELGNQINASEGIVFRYGDRLIKLTGSFAAINQILGMRFQL